MAEYICREAVLKAFRLTAKNSNKDYQRGLQDAIDCLIPEVIADIPSADVQPVKWISVKDRLPEIGKSVLIYYPYWDGDEIQVAKLEYDEMMFDVCGEFNIRVGAVTHWMPLPKPPKDGDVE